MHHEYNYISEVPQRQLPNVSYINASLPVARPEIDRQYKYVGGNLADYPWMYNTPEQKTNRTQIRKYDNVPVHTVQWARVRPPAPMAQAAAAARPMASPPVRQSTPYKQAVTVSKTVTFAGAVHGEGPPLSSSQPTPTTGVPPQRGGDQGRGRGGQNLRGHVTAVSKHQLKRLHKLNNCPASKLQDLFLGPIGVDLLKRRDIIQQ